DLVAWAEYELKSNPDGGAGVVTGQYSGNDVKAVFERLAEGIVAFNDRGAIEWINPAAEFIFGYTSEQLAGQHIKRLMPVTFQSEITGHLTSRLLEGDDAIVGMRTEAVGRRKDGSTMQLSLSISEVRLAEGR